MAKQQSGLFARSGNDRPSLLTYAAVVIGGLGLGLGAGWLTSSIPGWVQGSSDEASGPVVSPSLSTSISASPLPEITRTLDDSDVAAGLVSLDIPLTGSGTFSAVPGSTTPTASDATEPIFVRVDIEDSLTDVNRPAIARYIMRVLNDSRGWQTTEGREFVRTDGVPTFRVVIATPGTAQAMCPDRYATATPPVIDVDPSASAPAASPSVTPGADEAVEDGSCADQGIVMIDLYDWAQGFATFGADRDAARTYLLNHLTGRLLLQDEVTCSSGLADVMTMQMVEGFACDVNPWPNPS